MMRVYTTNWSVFLLLTLFFGQAIRAKELERKLLTMKVEIDQVEYYLHYRAFHRPMALKVKEILTEQVAAIHAYFQYRPQTAVHFNLNDREEEANGMATPFPYNLIYLYPFVPSAPSSLAGSKDWLRILVVHEYAHTVTLDMTFGAFYWLRKLFGSTVKWAGLNPRWFLEGIATWAESNFTKEGRLRDPLVAQQVDLFLTQNMTWQAFTHWDNPPVYPYGSTAYWVGGFFLQYLELQQPGLLSCWARSNGGSIPFFVQSRFRSCSQRFSSLEEAFEQFKEERRAKIKSSCPFSRPHFCEQWKARWHQVDVFKGIVETEERLAFVWQSGTRGAGLGSFGEKLVILHKDQRKPLIYRFPHRLEAIALPEPTASLKENIMERYEPAAQQDSSQLLLTFLQDRPQGRTRLWRSFDLAQFKIKNLSSKECKLEPDPWSGQAVLVKMQPSPAPNPGTWCLFYHSGAQQWWWKFAKSGTQESLVAPDPVSASAPADATAALEGEHSYQPWAYLFPQHLFVNYLSTGTISYYSLSTTLVDPRQRHQINVGLTYNTPVNGEQSPWTTQATYSFNADPWLFSLSDLNYYFLFASTDRDEVFLQEQQNARLSYQFSFGQFQLQPGAYVERLEERDIFATRSLDRGGIFQRLSYQAPGQRQWLQQWMLETTWGQSKNRLTEKQYAEQSVQQYLAWQWGEDWQQSWLTSWAKMNLTDDANLVQGNYRGGGAPGGLFLASSIFPSYLVGQGQLMGQELLATSMRLDWTSYYPRWGSGFTPVYLKSLGPLFGLEYFYGDYLLHLNNLTTNPHYTSFFTGFKTSWDLFFLLPVDLEMIYAKNITGQVAIDQFQMLLQTSLVW